MSFSTCTLDTLPVEIQQQILSHLPLQTLLTFARTSKQNHDLSTSSLTTLHLAVFPKRIHGILAFLNTSTTFLDDPSLHQVAVPTILKPLDKPAARGLAKRRAHTSQSPTPAHFISPPGGTTAQQARHTSIVTQNNLLESLLSTRTLHALKSLHINTTAILSPNLTSVLATSFPHLRHLSLNFSHPYINEPVLPAKYWTTTPRISDEGTTAWNNLAGIGALNEERLRMMSLETLEVRRAGMTGRQCLEVVRKNKWLKVLRLGMVTGVDKEFVEALAKVRAEDGRTALKVLELEGCANLVLKTEDEFEGIQKMVDGGLRDLYLNGCEGVDEEVLIRLSKMRRWEEKGLRKVLLDEGSGETKSCDGNVGGDFAGTNKVLEVDPDYV